MDGLLQVVHQPHASAAKMLESDSIAGAAESKLRLNAWELVEECALFVRGMQLSMRLILKSEEQTRAFCECFAGEEVEATVAAGARLSDQPVVCQAAVRAVVLPFPGWQEVQRCGWDAILSPACLKHWRPISSLSPEERTLLDVRSAAWFKLRWKLTMHGEDGGEGLYEIHLTAGRGEWSAVKFVDVCGSANLSHYIFSLEDRSGRRYTQYQTGRFVRGSVEDARKVARDDAAFLESHDITTSRVRIEMVAKDADTRLSPGQYFEFHQRVREGVCEAEVRRLFPEAQVARSLKKAGRAFINWRTEAPVTLREATQRFHAIMAGLRGVAEPCPTRPACVREVCVYDSCRDLDTRVKEDVHR